MARLVREMDKLMREYCNLVTEKAVRAYKSLKEKDPSKELLKFANVYTYGFWPFRKEGIKFVKKNREELKECYIKRYANICKEEGQYLFNESYIPGSIKIFDGTLNVEKRNLLRKVHSILQLYTQDLEDALVNENQWRGIENE